MPAADIDVYRRGVNREVSLVRAAIAALRRTGDADERAVVAAGATPERTALQGARAAGLPLDRYRQLVAMVDSALLTSGDGASGGAGAAGSRELDSLRIELVVARSRLAAEIERRCQGGSGAPC